MHSGGVCGGGYGDGGAVLSPEDNWLCEDYKMDVDYAIYKNYRGSEMWTVQHNGTTKTFQTRFEAYEYLKGVKTDEQVTLGGESIGTEITMSYSKALEWMKRVCYGR